MKKLILLAFVVGMAEWVIAGDQYRVPEADSAQPAWSADFVGLSYSTSQFSNALSTPCVDGVVSASGRFIVAGVTFSTGSTSDFVQFFDAPNVNVANSAGEVTRVYNMANSTMSIGATPGGLSAGYSPVGARPIRFNKGLMYKPSSSNYNSIVIHLYKP